MSYCQHFGIVIFSVPEGLGRPILDCVAKNKNFSRLWITLYHGFINCCKSNNNNTQMKLVVIIVWCITSVVIECVNLGIKVLVTQCFYEGILKPSQLVMGNQQIFTRKLIKKTIWPHERGLHLCLKYSKRQLYCKNFEDIVQWLHCWSVLHSGGSGRCVNLAPYIFNMK